MRGTPSRCPSSRFVKNSHKPKLAPVRARDAGCYSATFQPGSTFQRGAPLLHGVWGAIIKERRCFNHDPRAGAPSYRALAICATPVAKAPTAKALAPDVHGQRKGQQANPREEGRPPFGKAVGRVRARASQFT